MIDRKLLSVAGLVMLSAACSGKPAPAAGAPTRLIPLKADDPEVLAIAKEASRFLPLSGSRQLMFGGVYVNGRKSREATDAVVRATGYRAAAGTSAGAARVECRVQSSTGQSTPVPCPAGTAATAAGAAAFLPPILSFVEVRSTTDSAYVGLQEEGDKSSKHSCITLTRVAGSWKTLRTSVIADAKRCGA